MPWRIKNRVLWQRVLGRLAFGLRSERRQGRPCQDPGKRCAGRVKGNYEGRSEAGTETSPEGLENTEWGWRRREEKKRQLLHRSNFPICVLVSFPPKFYLLNFFLLYWGFNPGELLPLSCIPNPWGPWQVAEAGLRFGIILLQPPKSLGLQVCSAVPGLPILKGPVNVSSSLSLNQCSPFWSGLSLSYLYPYGHIRNFVWWFPLPCPLLDCELLEGEGTGSKTSLFLFRFLVECWEYIGYTIFIVDGNFGLGTFTSSVYSHQSLITILTKT